VSNNVLTLRSPADDIDVVHAFYARVCDGHLGLDEIDRFRFETALIELASNVIQHADDGNGIIADILLEITSDTIRATITDSSPAGEVEISLRAMPDELDEHGRGIAFIQRLVDELHYERRGAENIWRIEKRRTAS
jgi:serine/threonine-protein kinase RsbW